MRKRVALMLVIAFAATFLIIFLVYRNQPLGLTPAKLPLTSTQTTVVKNPHEPSLVFSNGRFLLSYDFTGGSTKRLSQTDALPAVTDIKFSSSDPDFLIFQTLEQIDVKELRDSVLEANQKFNSSFPERNPNPYKIDSPTWWQLNIKTGQLSFVGQSSNVEWDNDRLILIDNSQIVSRDVTKNVRDVLYESAEIYNFHKEGGTLLVDTSNGLVSYDLSSKISAPIPSDGYVLFSDSSLCYLTIEAKEGADTADIYLNKCPGKKKVGQSEREDDFFGFNDAGNNILVQKSTVLTVYDTTLEVLNSWRLEEGYRLLRALDQNILLLESDSILYVANLSGKTPKIIGREETLGFNKLTATLDPRNQAINIRGGEDNQPNQAQVKKLLKDKGYDINVYKLFWEPVSFIQ